MKKLIAAIGLTVAVSVAMLPASGQEELPTGFMNCEQGELCDPKCSYQDESHDPLSVILHTDDKEYVCLCRFDPAGDGGSDGSLGAWLCEWHTGFRPRPTSQ